MNTVTVEITRTARSFGRYGEYRIFDEERRDFVSENDARKFLEDEYGSCKRSKIYCDAKDGPIHTGWVRHFRDRWEGVCRQDWITSWSVSEKITLIS